MRCPSSSPACPRPQCSARWPWGRAACATGVPCRSWWNLSTVGSRAMRAAAAGLAERGIALVDAPVSGGAAGAKKATLAVMAAGAPAAVDQVMDLLQIFGKVFRVGPEAGQAQLLKLLNNMLSSTAFAITSEAFVAGVKGGLDPAVMMAAINAGSGRSGASQDKFMKQVMPRSFDFGFPMASVCKDIGLAVEECEAPGRSNVGGQFSAPAVELCRPPARHATRHDRTGEVGGGLGRDRSASGAACKRPLRRGLGRPCPAGGWKANLGPPMPPGPRLTGSTASCRATDLTTALERFEGCSDNRWHEVARPRLGHDDPSGRKPCRLRPALHRGADRRRALDPRRPGRLAQPVTRRPLRPLALDMAVAAPVPC